MKVTIALLCLLLIPGPILLAEEPTAEESGRILNLSGRQRMLTQKMTKELLLAANEVAKDRNLQNASATVALFDSTLYSLRDGNDELGLPATTDARLLRQIGKVDELWIQYKSVVEDIISKGTVSAADVAKIAELNLPLLKEMNKCVTLYERQVTGASMSDNPALAIAVNLSGKQRMLSQRITKELLLITYGHEVENNQLLLTESYSLFDRTLKGLRNGDEILELSASVNTPEILEQLSIVEKVWSQYLPLIKKVANGEKPNSNELLEIQSVNLTLLTEMNKAVGMYEKLTG